MSKSSVIEVHNVSKKYQIYHDLGASHNTLIETLSSQAREVMSRLKTKLGKKPSESSRIQTEELWALKDVSFDLKVGDRLGIIGKNGAGKSTLLKILSRIIEPTTGRMTIRGKISSLLEVGTGFHPELTGRENIFLNGAILGMSKVEIIRKFDEIVEFSEIEKFLDTPVKRYSSGMYARLGFAIAAHLDPDILILDEVLAVGDSSFQKKCLAKMQDLGSSGRTIIFLSHSADSVLNLCNKAIYLESGRIKEQGDVKKCFDAYEGIQNLSLQEV